MAEKQQLCTFYLDGQCFGVGVEQVQEVIRPQGMTAVPLAPRPIGGLINLRGQIVTAIDLRCRLGLSDRPQQRLPMNVVVKADDGAISLLVDEIGNVVEVAEDCYEPPPDTLHGEARRMIRGVYKLKGVLLHLLELDNIVKTTALSGNEPAWGKNRAG